MRTLQQFVLAQDIMVVAHRGSSGTAPENTLAAIREALVAGAHMIEIDVQFTADDEAIVFHDAVLGRTTDGSGKIRKLHSSDLCRLDAGTWFDPRFEGEKIPLLGEALTLLRDKAYVNIEIKPPQPDEDYTRRIDRIASIIERTGMRPYTLFSSFHYDSLVYLKSLSTMFHTAAIHIPGDPRLPSDVAEITGCEAYVCALRDFTQKRSQDALEHHIYVGVYTINTAEDARIALDRKAKAIVTNFPARIIEALYQFQGKTP